MTLIIANRDKIYSDLYEYMCLIVGNLELPQ